jgi:methylthioribose-1-phosphate isomerase/methylthioribulose-1-phosphate dehydratase
MAPDDDAGYDTRRREFFRVFGRQTVRNAGAVLGAASELRRVGGEAARELLDLGVPMDSPRSGAVVATEPLAPTTASFRSAYRIVDDTLVLLDQRGLPGETNAIPVHEPSEVASAIRLGVTNAGPILGELCAYSLALGTRRATFRAGADTLRAARSDVRAIGVALERMTARFEELAAEAKADGADLADGLRSEADAIAMDDALAHATLARTAAEALAAAAPQSMDPLTLLMHADMGPLSCGLVGTGTAIVQSLLAMGRRVHVWLTEAAPGMEGTRLAAAQMMQIDAPHTVIADTAVGWLLAEHRIDAALLRADYVCANGDTASVIGALNVAALARAAGVPVYAVAPRTAFDPAMPDGRSLVPQLEPPGRGEAGRVPAVRLNPLNDVVPAARLSGSLTEEGLS